MEVLFLIDFPPVTEKSVHFFYWKVPSLCHFVSSREYAEYKEFVEWYWQGKPEVLGGKNPVPMPLRAPQIPHGLVRGRLEAGDPPPEPKY
jgi:hypothetical protein